MPSPLAILKKTFGYDAFRPGQEEIVRHVTGGGSCLVLMPTGGGKSLCYQVPALARPGLGLVISPLIALMQDQVQALRQAGARADFYNSTLSQGDKARVRSMARSGELDLLYAAPETLNTEFFRGFIQDLPLSLIAVDEAHCVSQWGHDFRPDYLEIASLRAAHSGVPLVALTATADPLTRKEIRARLGLENDPVFASSFDRPNIRYEVTLKDSAREQLLAFLRERHAGDAGIVYCLSRKKVEETAEWLSRKGVPALPYHAGLDAATRAKNQDRFIREEGLVICATIAFGMGIDKPDVRFVAHLDLPKSVEGYYQETGRAGRDGEPASAWMAYGLGDVVQLRQFIAGGEGSDEFKRLSQQKLNAMLGFCETLRCRRQALLAYFGEEHAGGCGNCDNCLGGVKGWDGTLAAQKALSAVARTGNRFGAAHLIDILMGKVNEKIARYGHASLSVYGVGKDLDERRWSSVFRQLVAGGWLDVDAEAMGALKLNERSWKVLKEGEKVQLREDPPARFEGRGGKAKAVRTAPGEVSEADEAAFQELRALRWRLAKEQNLPPYVVFHDATLREMVARRPASLAALARVPGVGEAKLERYGAEFLSELSRLLGLSLRDERPSAAPLEREKPDSSSGTLALFRSGQDIPSIALSRGLTVNTIWNHLAECVESGKLRWDEAVPLERPERDALLSALAEHDGKLKPVFEKFGGKYNYEALKIVRAGAGFE